MKNYVGLHFPRVRFQSFSWDLKVHIGLPKKRSKPIFDGLGYQVESARGEHKVLSEERERT